MDYIQKEEETQNAYANLDNRGEANVYETLNLNANPSKEDGSCADGWQRFKSSYYYVSTEAKDWSTSRKDCQTKQGDLVVIDSREEHEFLVTWKKNFTVFWIGLSDIETEGVWTWVDGTRLHQEYWKSGEPNNVGQDEDCAVSHHSSWLHWNLQLWNDISCSTKSH
ncbi:C-type lectin domain family 4 member E-like [Alosa alosa]|uniref:C-type lectin domain family 4 member E-like n=1 Tax=Alosa alosa TaxID=278164 RepID=UPI0020152643|nr:C-type lectin domain family 4 member E-like [Alosa alosa]